MKRNQKSCYSLFPWYVDTEIIALNSYFNIRNSPFVILQSDDILLAAPSPTHVPHSEGKLEQSEALTYNGDVGIWSRSQSIRVKSSSVQSSFRVSDSRNDLSRIRGATGGSVNLHKNRNLKDGSFSGSGRCKACEVVINLILKI